MNHPKLAVLISAFIATTLSGCYMQNAPIHLGQKISGVSLVAGREVSTEKELEHLDSVGAKWVAIIPFAFAPGHSPELHFNHSRQWGGETASGVGQQIVAAHSKGLKVMVKPHVWVRGDGWAGDFVLQTEAEWATWEKNYLSYIMTYLKVADSLNAEIFCIGTEFNQAIIHRPDFWVKLATTCRANFKGKLTYAANWDNYMEVSCWEQVDYIGIDAYFPISDEKTPSVKQLKKNWVEPKKSLEKLSQKFNRPILFTEYGYRSADYAAAKHWELNEKEQPLNLQAQSNTYEALFQSFWDEPWFSGGFLWKWYPDHPKAGGMENNDYTPQNKPAEVVIKKWYGREANIPQAGN
jgi:hypothetical protein